MSFDALAPHYRWMEWFLAGKKLQRCRTRFLNEVPLPKRILLLGEGPGRCLVHCCQTFPGAQIVCVDSSRKMLEEAMAAVREENVAGNHVQLVHDDVLQWNAGPQQFDLIITNFFLDCFPEKTLQMLIEKIGMLASADANWLIADFQIPTSGWRRLRAVLMVRAMYMFFRTVTGLPAREIVVPDPFLEHEGFVLCRRFQSEWGLLHSDWWQRTG